MTSLRGPDPYAEAEERLAALFDGRDVSLVAVCRALHEAVPTYSCVGIARRGPDGFELIARFGKPMTTALIAEDCLPGPDGSTLVVHDVLAAPGWRRCFPGARALIALSVGRDRALFIASEHRGAFGLADRELLEMVARRLDPAATE